MENKTEGVNVGVESKQEAKTITKKTCSSNNEGHISGEIPLLDDDSKARVNSQNETVRQATIQIAFTTPTYTVLRIPPPRTYFWPSAGLAARPTLAIPHRMRVRPRLVEPGVKGSQY